MHFIIYAVDILSDYTLPKKVICTGLNYYKIYITDSVKEFLIYLYAIRIKIIYRWGSVKHCIT